LCVFDVFGRFMTMATATIKPTREADGDQCVALGDVGWKGYSTLLRLRGERYVPRIVYLDGTVWLMSPGFPHERLKKRLGWVVEVIVEELDIPCIAAASTTFRRRTTRGGVEGDQTYYLANLAGVRDKKKLHLKTDPPPDLAIEAVDSHDAEAAMEVYRRLRVPEVWVCDQAELIIMVLQANGRYAASETSASFPFLGAADVFDWVHRPAAGTDTEWLKGLRRWVRTTLKPPIRRPKEQDD
jgi:Uma2 family endonuclease